MSDVFISYSRLDKDFVGKLRDALANNKQDVWIDWESIAASQLWWQEIRKGIDKANNFVLILSPNSMASPICQMEIEYARQIGKRIIPVVHAEFDRKACLMSIAERLAVDDETATREIWGSRQAHDIYDANVAAIKPINYFFFKADADFITRFDDLLDIINTDPVHKEKHTTLGLRAAEWDRRKRDVSFLLLGSELTDAEHWQQDAATDKEPLPTALQTAYISASRRSSNRRRVATISGIVIAGAAVIFAGGASLVGINAVNQVATATIEQGEAVIAQRTAVAQADAAKQESQNARGQVAVAEVTLTSVPPVLTAVALALADAEVEQEIGLQLANASLSMADQDMVSALQIVDSLVDRFPQKSLAYLSRALIFMNSNKMDEALADYNKALALDPNNAIAYSNRGSLYSNLAEYDKAIADYTRSIELDPTDPSTYYNRGATYSDMEAYDKALADMNKVIELDPTDDKSYHNRANIYRYMSEYPSALADANKAIELNPDEPLYYATLGDIYMDMEAYDQALEYYQVYLNAAGDNPDPTVVEQVQAIEAELGRTPIATMTATK